MPSHLFQLGNSVARYHDGSEVARAVLEHSRLGADICDKVFQGIAHECKQLTKKKERSFILRHGRPQDLRSFTVQKFEEELSAVAPTLMKVLVTAASSERQIHQERKKPKRGKDIGILTAAAILLKCRDKDMSALHHLIGLLLHHEGCTKQALRQLSGMKICTFHTSVLRKMDEICAIYDQELLEWKNAIEVHASFVPVLTSGAVSGLPVDYQIVGDNLDLQIAPPLVYSEVPETNCALV